MTGFKRRLHHGFLHLRLATLAMVLGLPVSCASLSSSSMPSSPSSDNNEKATSDPFESINRRMYDFNEYLDRHVGKPVADAYVKVIPGPVRGRISNFFSNLSYPNVFVNDFLQGKFKQGLSDTGRFLVNTTVGVGGLFDVATVWGLESHDEDFGQTLATWGVGKGPYLMLPTVGPSTTRDAPDLALKSLTNLFLYVGPAATITIPVTVVGFISRRANAGSAIRSRDESAAEPYLFTREAYLQHRTYLIYDGSPPLPADMLPEEILAGSDGDEEILTGSDGDLEPSLSAPKQTL